LAATHRALLVAFLLACAGEVAAEVLATGLVLPGLVSTPAAEVKLTISPDGGRMLWGTGRMDIYRIPVETALAPPQ
jgi:hypothetical protein